MVSSFLYSLKAFISLSKEESPVVPYPCLATWFQCGDEDPPHSVVHSSRNSLKLLCCLAFSQMELIIWTTGVKSHNLCAYSLLMNDTIIVNKFRKVQVSFAVGNKSWVTLYYNKIVLMVVVFQRKKGQELSLYGKWWSHLTLCGRRQPPWSYCCSTDSSPWIENHLHLSMSCSSCSTASVNSTDTLLATVLAPSCTLTVADIISVLLLNNVSAAVRLKVQYVASSSLHIQNSQLSKIWSSENKWEMKWKREQRCTLWTSWPGIWMKILIGRCSCNKNSHTCSRDGGY